MQPADKVHKLSTLAAFLLFYTQAQALLMLYTSTMAAYAPQTPSTDSFAVTMENHTHPNLNGLWLRRGAFASAAGNPRGHRQPYDKLTRECAA